jgi:hypothetical protein
MNLNRLASLVSRVFSIAASLLLILAIAEWVSNAAGYTILGQAYKPGRLVELAAISTIFVIALLLRQVREEIRKNHRTS